MIDILIILIIVMVALIIGFILFIVANHLSSQRRKNLLEKNKDKWENKLYEYLEGDIPVTEIANLIKGNYVVQWEFLKPYLTNLKGEDREKILILAKETSMTGHFFKKIKRGRKKERMMAASVLGKLGEKDVVSYLKNMLFSKDTAEMTFAAKAIADLKETGYMIPVFRRMLTDTHTTYEGVSEIAVRFGRDICLPANDIIQEWLDGTRDLEETFKVPEEESLSLLVDILGYYRYVEASPQLEYVLVETRSNEVIIHILKALMRLEHPVSTSLIPFLEHEDWIIRSQTAIYIGKMGEETYKEKIKELLTDENWWVRYYAAQALYNLGEVPYLRSLSNSDDIAAEMSRYILSLS